jgi:NAD+ kinase
MKLTFTSANNSYAQEALKALTQRYGQCPLTDADFIVALGGDGHVLKTLYDVMSYNKPIFAMRRTESVGFLCNNFEADGLLERLGKAQAVYLQPLRFSARGTDGHTKEALAINEVTVIRETPQSARLRISVDGVVRLAQYSGDGVLVTTPTGSTAYNHSCGGPILPLDANTLTVTAISGYRPRGWHYAVLPQDAVVEIEALETSKRPVRIEAGSTILHHAASVKIWRDNKVSLTLLFDPGQHLGERIIREQFML